MDELRWILTVVIGVFLPPLLAYADRKKWGSTPRTVVAWGLSAVVAIIWAAVTGRLGWNWPTGATIGIMIVTAESAYNVFWKLLGASAGGTTAQLLIRYLLAKLTKMPPPP